MTTQEQRSSALAAANETRMAVARLRRDLRGMERAAAAAHLGDLIATGDDAAVEATRIARLFRMLPRVGEHKTTALLKPVCHQDTRVRDLSRRQRLTVANLCYSPVAIWPCYFHSKAAA